VEAQLISAFSDLKQWPTGCEKNGTTADERIKKKLVPRIRLQDLISSLISTWGIYYYYYYYWPASKYPWALNIEDLKSRMHE